MIDEIQKRLLKEVADLDSLPVGAYNIRANGAPAGRNTTAHINIVTKTDKPGIDIIIAPGTNNDFYIGENADVVIIAGCGIHCAGAEETSHDGIHTFHVGKGAHLRYVEKHYGEGEGRGKRVMNPTTIVYLEEGASMDMETTQIAGVDDTLRKTGGTLAAGSTLTVHEKIMTTGDQHAITDFAIDLNGENCSTDVVSRSMATISAPVTSNVTPSCWIRPASSPPRPLPPTMSMPP